MSFEERGAVAPLDQLCRYGASRLACRGPKRPTDAPYVACLGGSETYGKFVAKPFAALLEEGLGCPCLNLGSLNAGLDALVNDPELPAMARAADLCVLQVPGVQNLSNRYYRVHPRRNDRFLEPTPLLTSIYSEVDFTEFHFVNHLLSALHDLCPARFKAIEDELRRVWLARMRLLLKAVGDRTLLLWLRYEPETSGAVGSQPVMVDRDMLAELDGAVRGVIEIPVTPAKVAGELEEMCFGPLQAPAAAHMIGPAAHRRIAAELLGAVRSELAD